jgi:hypothetical protein
VCWCGQRWDGEKMCFMPETAAAPAPTQNAEPSHQPSRVGQN